jgi:hypothetical protein
MQNLLILVEPPTSGAFKKDEFQVPNFRLQVLQPTKQYFSRMRMFDKCLNDIVVLNKSRMGRHKLVLAETNRCLEDYSFSPKFCPRKHNSSESSESSARDSDNAKASSVPQMEYGIFEFESDEEPAGVVRNQFQIYFIFVFAFRLDY